MPGDLFAHPTIAALATAAGTATAVTASQAAVTGDAPLTPVQRWFLDAEPVQAQHFTQSMLLDVPDDREALDRALNVLLAHHDALRTTFAEGQTTKPVQAPGLRVQPEREPDPHRPRRLHRGAGGSRSRPGVRQWSGS